MSVDRWSHPRRSWPALAFLALAGCADDSLPTAVPARATTHATTTAAVAVLNTGDHGPGSLRQAIADATDGATIQFDAAVAGKTIALDSAITVTGKVLTIEGATTTGITLDGNQVTRVLTVSSDANLTLRNVTITGGRAEAGGGIGNFGVLTLEHSTVTGNVADINLCTSLCQVAGAGGGVLNNDGDVVLINSTVSGNTGYDGGGISNQEAFASPTPPRLTLVNSTMANNTSHRGGAVHFEDHGTLTIRNSILANNSATEPASYDTCDLHQATLIVIGAALFSDPGCWPTTPPAGAIVASPIVLGALANNGGPTRTHALPKGSAAIDNGLLCNVTVDQRYVARPQGLACDIGAYEFNSYATVSLTVDASAAVNPNNGVAVVTGSLTCSEPLSVQLQVALRQEQKVGRVSAVVQASDASLISCSGTRFWSIALTPPTGAFKIGTGVVTAQTPTDFPNYVIGASAEQTVKMFWGHK
jgi:hypothetical protein